MRHYPGMTPETFRRLRLSELRVLLEHAADTERMQQRMMASRGR